MRYWTWAEIKEKMENELDLQGEIFVDDPELLAYANEGIDECESQIHSLYEDYFLMSTAITLVAGTSKYNLPSTIYAHKIRKVVYRNGTTVAEIKRLRDRSKIINYTANRASGSANAGSYDYFLENATAGAPQIVFTPAVNESGEYVEIWHIRNANRLVEDSDVCDIPEFVNYVMKYIKKRVYDKEGHPHLGLAAQELEDAKQDMVSTLAGMVADDDNEIEADLSFYNEMT